MLCGTYNNATEASCSLSNNYIKVQSAAHQYIEYDNLVHLKSGIAMVA